MKSHRTLNRKAVIALAALGCVFSVIGGFFLLSFVGFILFPIIPNDVRIYRTIQENSELLEGIDGVLAAGIGSDGTNHIVGINIYIDENMTNPQAVPGMLGDFPTILVRIDNTHPRDTHGIFWYSQELKIWPRETPEAT